MGKTIQLTNIHKKYQDTTVLQEISLSIKAGERIVLLGPSGSGKSTLLRIIAGLEEITDGELYLGETLANHLQAGEREIAMVFQNYALYPHMTVSQNILFALKANKIPQNEQITRLNEALEMLGLTPYKDRLPKALSGGQRQRVALARAVVKRSDYFLLDEPLSNLDVRLRLDARKELVAIHDRYQQTFVYVTHDQIEAMTLAHRIVLLNDGYIQMVDTPDHVYSKPINVFSAGFIGSPGMNIFPIVYRNGDILMDSQKISANSEWKNYLNHQQNQANFLMGIRPEHIQLTQDETKSLKGTVKYTELLGQNYAITVDVSGSELIVLHEKNQWKLGDTVFLHFPQEKLHFFSQETEKNLGYPDFIAKGDNQNETVASL